MPLDLPLTGAQLGIWNAQRLEPDSPYYLVGEVLEIDGSAGDARAVFGQQALAELGEDELGDLLFVCVNLARFMKVNPEQALNRTNHKFDARFRAIERVLEREGRDMDEESLEALDAVWQAVKGVERGENEH